MHKLDHYKECSWKVCPEPPSVFLQGRLHLINRHKPTATLIYNIYTSYILPADINTLSDVKIH